MTEVKCHRCGEAELWRLGDNYYNVCCPKCGHWLNYDVITALARRWAANIGRVQMVLYRDCVIWRVKFQDSDNDFIPVAQYKVKRDGDADNIGNFRYRADIWYYFNGYVWHGSTCGLAAPQPIECKQTRRGSL